jgi:diaminohydroxyphosphoribosylaminopyrimidine deaminase/5-amino-6-(5-phosphoribosylamino)uracil reductase
MHRALDLARRAAGRTAPNPAVGAVIVRDGVIVGEGFHPAAGEAHAEIFASSRLLGERRWRRDLDVSRNACAA